MTDVYVISGFLGAGKTTLIKTMVHSAFKNKKLVVIENDFGEAGIDAGLLKECNLAVTSLSDGGICCSLTGDFDIKGLRAGCCIGGAIRRGQIIRYY